MEPVVNILLDAFPGLGLPPTVCLPLPASSTTEELVDAISDLLPKNFPTITRLILTLSSNLPVHPSPTTTIASLSEITSCQDDGYNSFLPLRLSAPLVGGKGGFGSQLRAAGGRMSSRKKRQNAELATGSARNLDGRRLRTITEAKNLATYLATKPDMDKKEKEERRKRWEQVVDMAEQREADMRAGKGPDGRRNGLSDEWIETKEEVGENVRNAVKAGLVSGRRKAKARRRSRKSRQQQQQWRFGSRQRERLRRRGRDGARRKRDDQAAIRSRSRRRRRHLGLGRTG